MTLKTSMAKKKNRNNKFSFYFHSNNACRSQIMFDFFYFSKENLNKFGELLYTKNITKSKYGQVVYIE